VGTVRILYRASTISLQAAVHPKHMLGALNMKEEEEPSVSAFNNLPEIYLLCVSVHNKTFALLYTSCCHSASQAALQFLVPRILTAKMTVTTAYKILHRLDDTNQRNF
jgi:hypothetical protein